MASRSTDCAGFSSFSVTRPWELLGRRPTAHSAGGIVPGCMAARRRWGAALGLPNPSFPSVGRSEAHGWHSLCWEEPGRPMEPCHQQGCPAVSGTETSGPFVAAVLPWLRRPPLQPPVCLSVPSCLPCALETRVRLILLSSARPFGTHALPKVPRVMTPFLRGPPGWPCSPLGPSLPARSQSRLHRWGQTLSSQMWLFPHLPFLSHPHCAWTIWSNEEQRIHPHLTAGRQRPHVPTDTVPGCTRHQAAQSGEIRPDLCQMISNYSLQTARALIVCLSLLSQTRLAPSLTLSVRRCQLDCGAQISPDPPSLTALP